MKGCREGMKGWARFLLAAMERLSSPLSHQAGAATSATRAYLGRCFDALHPHNLASITPVLSPAPARVLVRVNTKALTSALILVLMRHGASLVRSTLMSVLPDVAAAFESLTSDVSVSVNRSPAVVMPDAKRFLQVKRSQPFANNYGHGSLPMRLLGSLAPRDGASPLQQQAKAVPSHPASLALHALQPQLQEPPPCLEVSPPSSVMKKGKATRSISCCLSDSHPAIQHRQR